METPLLLLAIIELTSLFVAFFYTLQIRVTWKKAVIYIFFVGLPSTVLLFLVHQWIAITYMVIASFVVLYLFTQKIHILLHISVIIIICIFAEVASTYISTLILHGVHASSIVDTVLFLMIFAIITFFYGRFMQRINDTIQLSYITQGLLIAIALITMIVFYLNILIPIYEDQLQLIRINLIVQLVYFLFMMMLVGLLIVNIKKQNAIQRKEIEHAQFNNYMQALEQVNRDMQKFRHDYINILLTMRAYLDQGDLTNLNAYFNQTILKVEQQTIQKNRAFGQLEHLHKVELKGLLATKLLLADEMNIPIQVNIPSPIHTINMDIIDLTRVIGILLDNAVEASTAITKPQVHIAFFKTDVSVTITIENKCDTATLQIDELFEENYSTKGKGHGLGLSTVKHILSNYPYISLDTRLERGWFIQEMDIIDDL